MPTYHSRADAKIERMVADQFKAMGWRTSLMDVSCRWDIEATWGSQYLIVEVKRRNMNWGDYPTVFLDKSKADAMLRRAAEVKGLPILVIVPNDMQPRLVYLHDPSGWKTNTVDVRPERRDASDRGDLKYEIPVGLFTSLETLGEA